MTRFFGEVHLARFRLLSVVASATIYELSLIMGFTLNGSRRNDTK